MTNMAVPTDDQVVAFHSELSNWGRWGPDDQLGTVNFITEAVTAQATGLVEAGVSISCAREMKAGKSPLDPFSLVQRYMIMTGEGLSDEDRIAPPTVPGAAQPARGARAFEFFGCVFHGAEVTHVDALSHVFWDGRTYNGGAAAHVNSWRGATNLDVTALGRGIVTRAVLIDIPVIREGKALDAGEGAMPEDLLAAEERFGFRIGSGDAVLLRTGAKPTPGGPGQAGWHAACLPLLHEREVALIGSDTAQDVIPSGYATCPLPVHMVGMVAMGLCLIDNCDLDALAQECDERGRYEFLLAVAPLKIEGGTGSPVNPIAIF